MALTYNPLEGYHERGHTRRGSDSSIGVVDDDAHGDCAGLLLPAVAGSRASHGSNRQGGRSGSSSPVSHGLPVMSSTTPRTITSRGSSISNVTGCSALEEARRAAREDSVVGVGASMKRRSFRRRRGCSSHGLLELQSSVGSDVMSEGKSSSRRSSLFEQLQMAPEPSTPLQPVAFPPQHVLLLSTKADEDGRSHWKSRWCIILRGVLRFFKSKRKARSVLEGHSRRPVVWIGLTDVCKVLRLKNGTTLPGTQRVVSHCLEISAAHKTLFVQAKSAEAATTLGCNMFHARKLKKVIRTGTNGRPTGFRREWCEHRLENGGAMFFREATGECTAAVRDMASGGRVHATHVLFEPPPDNSTQQQFSDLHASAALSDDDDDDDDDDDGVGGGNNDNDDDDDDAYDSSVDVDEGSNMPNLGSKVVSSPTSSSRRVKPVRVPIGKFNIPAPAGNAAHHVLATATTSPALVGALTTPVGDYRGLHIDTDAASIVSNASSFKSDQTGHTEDGPEGLLSCGSRGSLVSSGSSPRHAPGTGMLMLQLSGQCNTWAGSRRNLFSSSSPRQHSRRLSSSTGSSRVSSSSGGSDGSRRLAAVAESNGNAGAGGGKEEDAGAKVRRRRNKWYELNDPATGWPYYVNADTHHRQWEWPSHPGARVVHWADTGSAPPQAPTTPRSKAAVARGAVTGGRVNGKGC